MINLIVGKPGSGKTYYLTHLAYKFYNQNKKIYSNFFIDLPGIIYYKNLKELENAENGIIIMDEAQIFLNSRKWDMLPEFFQYKLQQHRKDGLDIWASTQHEARLDTVFREIVGRFFVVHRFFHLFFVITEFDPNEMKRNLKTVQSMRFVLFSKKIASLYDTFKKIDFDLSDDFIYKEAKLRICPKCGSKKMLF
jgi:GTPase SAR1 family protein